MAIKVAVFITALIAADIIGMALYYLSMHFFGKPQKRDRDELTAINSEDVSLMMPESDHDDAESLITVSSVAGDRNCFKLTFKTKGDRVEDYSNDIIDKMLAVRGFADKVDEDDIVCDIIDDGKAEIEIIIHFNGEIDDLEIHRAYKKVMKILRAEDRVKKIKLSEFTDDEEEEEQEDAADQKYVELTFKTKGEDVEDFSSTLVLRMLHNEEFEKKVHLKEVNVLTDTKAEVTFILKADEATVMKDKAMTEILALLKDNDRVKKINVKVVEDVEAKRKSLEAKRKKKVPAEKFVSKISKRVAANLLLFEVIGQDAREYGYELIERIMAVPGLRKEIYEKNLAIINKKKSGCKAKISIVLIQVQGQDALDNPRIKQVYDMLMGDRLVRKVRINKIPYFL